MLSIRVAEREASSSRYDEIEMENDFVNLIEDIIGISAVNSLERKWKSTIFEAEQPKKSDKETRVERSNLLPSNKRIQSNEKKRNSSEIPTNTKQVVPATATANILKPRQKTQPKAVEDDINVMIVAHNKKNSQAKTIDKSNFFAYNKSNHIGLSSQSTNDV